ncbi:MAG: hypothetical protein FWC06_00620 [Treponema sp.]|nr:hypothetical protein [Treponema sp.]
MEVTVQIFTGGFSGASVPFELIEQKLLSFINRFRVTKVIMGWSVDKPLYEKTAALLSKHNIEYYLWFPVFSETGALKNLSPLVDYTGSSIDKSDNNPDEDFFFCCPNNRFNIAKITDIFNENFASIKFNGVFLDRIRYPSFAGEQGKRGVFTCFCPECIKIYRSENFDIEKLKLSLCDPEFSLLGLKKYLGSGMYEFQDKVISSFFQIKRNIIYYSLQRICMYFRKKNYSIGLDVFAPFLSQFTGQDIVKLSGLCDFIKPMMYRTTCAPAGLPFETEALLQQTCGTENDNYKRFFKLLGIKPEYPPSAYDVQSGGFKNKPFDVDFTVKELHDLSLLSFCPVYAGIEINRVKDAAQPDPAYIEETIKAYSKAGIRGFTLSWNLLDMPEENIDKAVQLFSS